MEEENVPRGKWRLAEVERLIKEVMSLLMGHTSPSSP